MNPMIFSVMAWKQNNDETFSLDIHLVAADTSANAEKIFIESEGEFVHSHLFITTDRYMESYGKPTRMYSTRYTNDDNISVHDYRNWVRRSTRDSDNDGDTFPAAYRAFGLLK